MSSGLRCFVALTPPEGLRQSIAAYFDSEGRKIGGVRWVPAGGLHLTLAFLGEVAPDLLPALRAALDAAIAAHASFPLALRGAGAFPSVRRPRVVWVGTGAGATTSAALAACVEQALAAQGFSPPGRPFTPHLTVGRVKVPPKDPEALPRLMASVLDRPWGEFVVLAAHLVRSELFPSGPIYSNLHTARLSGIPRQA